MAAEQDINRAAAEIHAAKTMLAKLTGLLQSEEHERFLREALSHLQTMEISIGKVRKELNQRDTHRA